MNAAKLMIAALVALLAAAPAVAGDAETILANYESVRAGLARDDASGAPALARKIAVAAARALKDAKGDARSELDAIRAAAVQLEEAGGDLAASRAAFAPLSEGIVGLLKASPELASGTFMYACPMVKGYGQWVQVKKEIENPYKGSSMLRCAVPVK
jgi:hypothetical protein